MSAVTLSHPQVSGAGYPPFGSTHGEDSSGGMAPTREAHAQVKRRGRYTSKDLLPQGTLAVDETIIATMVLSQWTLEASAVALNGGQAKVE